MSATQERLVFGVDPNEAPEGFVAVPKPSGDDGNICRECDWRAQCCDPATDLAIPRHRCMGYPLFSIRKGIAVERADGCSVIFKRKMAEGGA